MRRRSVIHARNLEQRRAEGHERRRRRLFYSCSCCIRLSRQDLGGARATQRARAIEEHA